MPKKGKAREQAFAELLEAVNYTTWRPPKAKFREQDVFGIYDVLAHKQGLLYGCQVRSRAAGITEYFESAAEFFPPLVPLYAVYVDVDGADAEDEPIAWRLATQDREGYHWAVDERGMEVDAGEQVREWLLEP